jgi:hypothetical protein
MTSPYLRAAAKFPKVKLQAKERRDKRQGNDMRPGKPDKPAKPAKPKGKP